MCAEYAQAQQLFVDLCNTELLVEEYNKAKAAARRKREQQREDALKPPAQRKKEEKRRKEAEEKAKAEKAATQSEGGGGAAAEEEEDPVLLVERQKSSKLGAEARFVLEMETAIMMLNQGFSDRAKLLLTHGDEILSTLDCADPFVHASLYRAKAQYHKRVGPADQFFHNALRMSAYMPPDALSHTQQVAFAKELSLSAITGEGIYNFGEVVALPIFESLGAQDDCAWLMHLMKALNSGKMSEYTRVCKEYASDISGEPILHQNMDRLREKISLLCLMELVFVQKPEARSVTFAQVADVTQLPVDEVESLLMRAMSVGLIKGSIDEVDQLVRVSWLKPRVLDRDQIHELGKRFSSWRTTVREASTLVKDNAADVFA